METVERNAEQALALHKLDAGQRPDHAQPGAAGAAGRARARRGAAAHRVLRRLPPAGHRRGRVDGGLRGRAAAQERVPPVLDPRREAGPPTTSRAIHEVHHPPVPARPARGGRDRRARRRCRRPRRPPAIDPETGTAAEVRLPAATWSSSTAARRRSPRPPRALDELGVDDVALCGLAKRLEEVWLPGEDVPGDPAAHQRGALPAAAGPRRGAPVRDHVPPAAPVQGDDGQRPRRRARARARRGARRCCKQFGSVKRLRRRASTRSPRCPGIGPATRGGRCAQQLAARAPTHAGGQPRHRRGASTTKEPAVPIGPGRWLTTSPRRRRTAADAARRTDLVIITGLSGAGRTTAANVPGGPRLVRRRQPAAALLADAGRARRRRASQGDVDPDRRRGRRPQPGLLRRPAGRRWPSCASAGSRPRVLFLEASDEALVRRFEASAARTRCRATGGWSTASPASASCCATCAPRPTVVIDTRDLNVHELRPQGRRRVRRRGRPARCARP